MAEARASTTPDPIWKAVLTYPVCKHVVLTQLVESTHQASAH